MPPSSRALTEIARDLQDHIDAVSARGAAWGDHAGAASLAANHAGALGGFADRRRSLTARTEQITAQTAVTDRGLRASENELRELAERLEALRRKLAEWAARAIG